MQSLSHAALVALIRDAMNARNLTVSQLANEAAVGLLALSAMFAGQAYFNEKTLAALGEILNKDYSQIAARYALWKFYQAKDALKLPKPARAKHEAGQDALSVLAKEIARSHPPTTPSTLLVQYLMNAVPGIQEPMASSAIRYAVQNPSRGQGDYDAA